MTRVGIFRVNRHSLSEDNKFAIFRLVADMYLSASTSSAPGFAYPKDLVSALNSLGTRQVVR